MATNNGNNHNRISNIVGHLTLTLKYDTLTVVLPGFQKWGSRGKKKGGHKLPVPVAPIHCLLLYRSRTGASGGQRPKLGECPSCSLPLVVLLHTVNFSKKNYVSK